MPRRKPQPDQLSLIAGLEARDRERYALLDAIGHERSGLTRSRWKNVRALLKAIHRADRGDGCWASTDWLAEACEYSRRTLFRARDDALELGLVDIEHRARKTGNGGRDSNLWRVRWRDLARLNRQATKQPSTTDPPGADRTQDDRGAASLVASAQGVECQDAEVECHLAEVECQDGTAIRRVQSLVPPVRDGSGATEDFGFWDEGRRREVVALRARLIRAVGRPRSMDDVRDATAYAALSLMRFGEHWLWNAAEGVRTRRPAPNKPWAYLRRVLDEDTRELGHSLKQAMARCRYPAELLDPPKRGEQPVDLGERLCASGGMDFE